MEFIVENPDELSYVAKQLLEAFEHKIILLNGQLGAGKTTLVKEIVRIQNPSEEVSSPTFSLVNQYQLQNGQMYHIDLYRIEDLNEAMEMGIEEYLFDDHRVFIEWPDVILPLLDNDYHTITIEVLDNSRRRIKLHESTNKIQL